MSFKYIFIIGLLVVCFHDQTSIAEDSVVEVASKTCRSGPSHEDRVRSCSYVIEHSKDRNLIGRSYNRRGNANLLLKNYSLAEKDFSGAIKISPNLAGYYDNRQYALRMMGRYEEALQDANTAVRLAPDYSFVYRSRGNVYSEKQLFDLAISDFTRAIEIDRQDASLLVDRARVYKKKSLDSLVIKDLTLALTIDNQNINIVRERGLAYFRVGDVDKARSDLALVLKSSPQDAEVTQALARLNSINSSQNTKTTPIDTEKSAGAASAVSIIKPREIRIALVIGNGRYLHGGYLENPVQDAQAIAQAMRDAGFQKVYQKIDLGYEALRQSIVEFSTEAEKADWALIYYAGHGMEVNKTNYIIPVDAQLKADSAIQFETITLDQLLDGIAGAKKLSIVILDACRNNPFLERMIRTGRTRSTGSGLAKVDPDGSTMVAFSAKAGQLALDGVAGQRNSPFVAALIKNLNRPNVDIRKFFGLVRDDVLTTTNRRQEPAIYGSLGGEDYFIKAP